MTVTPGGAAWPPGGEPEGAPRDKPRPVLEASSGPKSFDQEVVDFLTQLDEDLKDYNDKGKAATPCSDKEVVDFLTQLDEVLKDYNDKGKAATPCSDKEVVDFLAQSDEDLKDYKDKGRAATPCSDKEVGDLLAQSNEDLMDYKDKDKATTGTPDGHRSATSTGMPPQCHGNGGRGQQPAPPQGASDKTSGSISTSMPSSASPGISPEPLAAHGPAIVPGLSQRHGDGCHGQQPAPPQGASDKTSGSISTSMPWR